MPPQLLLNFIPLQLRLRNGQILYHPSQLLRAKERLRLQPILEANGQTLSTGQSVTFNGPLISAIAYVSAPLQHKHQI